MFETQKFGNKTSSGEIGLDIRTHASPKWDRTRCLLACCTRSKCSIVLWKPHTIRLFFFIFIYFFNVTINDISVKYVAAHRCAGGLKKKLDLRSGSQRHRHFVGFFNAPVLAPTRDHPFYMVIRHTAPFSGILRSRVGYGGHILDLTPWALVGAQVSKKSKSVIGSRSVKGQKLV